MSKSNFLNINVFLTLISNNVMVSKPSRAGESTLIFIQPEVIKLIFIFFKHSTLTNPPLQLVDSTALSYVVTDRTPVTHAFYSFKEDTYVLLTTVSPDTGLVVDSTDSVYPATNWLEREMAEMTGIVFSNKTDNRNLMLEYTNVFKPLLKTFPSVGTYEIFFDTVKQTLIHKPVSLQL